MLSITSKTFAALALIFSAGPVALIAQVAFDPLFPIALHCGLLVLGSALLAIAALLALLTSMVIDAAKQIAA